ncbi:hypothetical protein ScPMuIL_016299 [Solemya velum]
MWQTCVLLSIVVTATTFANYEKSFMSTRERVKRQSADVKIAEYLARLGLGRDDCAYVGCGLVDVKASGKKKRTGDSSKGDDSRKNYLLSLLELS